MRGQAGGFVRRHAIGLVALFVALGGTSYALSSTGANGVVSACVKNKGGAVRLVKKGGKCHKGEHHASWNKQGVTGPDGPRGGVGPQGAQGIQGPKGDTGPAGAASRSMRIAGPLFTSSSSFTDLGGPSVTVNVGPSGLVEYWATATISTTGTSATVEIRDDTGSAPQITSTGGTDYTLPNSDGGTHFFNGGMSTEYVGPGPDTFKLEYAENGGGTATFTDVELVVVPL